MSPRSFLILYGWQGSGPDHWQSWLADRLRGAGEQVSYPNLPDPHSPRLEPWLGQLRVELERLGDGERVVVCHSLAVVLWLHHAATATATQRAARVLLAAPVCPPPAASEIASFFPAPLDRRALAAAAGHTLLVCSDDDPFCPAGADSVYGRPLGLQAEVIAGAGHLNPEAGYGPWPAVERWCLGGSI